MTFLLPLGLLGLLTLPLIVLFHLIQQRRRNVRVPSLELWNIAGAPPKQKPRRLPLTLLLLLHLLIAALLAFALGRPLIAGTVFEPVQTTVILDTSSSMATTDVASTSGSSRFENALAEAQRIFLNARTGDQIALVVVGSPPRLIGRGGPEAASGLIAALSTLRPAGEDGDLGAALNLAAAVTERPEGDVLRQQIVVLTDPAYASQPSSTAPLTANGTVTWRTFGQPVNNVALVAFAARPLRGGGHQLYARVANLGAVSTARNLEVLIDGNVVETEPVRLNSGAEAEWSWPLPAGASIAEARLTPGDFAAIDDSGAAVLTGGRALRVQLVSAAPTPLERALKAQPGVEVNLVAPQNYRHDPTADLAVLIDFVPPMLPPVPTLFVAPPSGSSLLEVTGNERNLRANGAPDSRFNTLDLSAVLFARVATVNLPDWATVALSADDVPLIVTGVHEGQPRTIWTFDPATSNLAGRLAFPLLTAATLRTLAPELAGTLFVGQPAPEALQAPDGTSVAAGTLLETPGIYRRAAQDGTIAVNTLDAHESDLRGRAPPPIEEIPLSGQMAANEGDRQLWRIILGAAVLLLIVEWLYSHRRNRRRRGRSAPPSQRPLPPRGLPRTNT